MNGLMTPSDDENRTRRPASAVLIQNKNFKRTQGSYRPNVATHRIGDYVEDDEEINFSRVQMDDSTHADQTEELSGNDEAGHDDREQHWTSNR